MGLLHNIRIHFGVLNLRSETIPINEKTDYVNKSSLFLLIKKSILTNDNYLFSVD